MHNMAVATMLCYFRAKNMLGINILVPKKLYKDYFLYHLLV